MLSMMCLMGSGKTSSGKGMLSYSDVFAGRMPLMWQM